MVVKYLAGNRLWGTNAERLALSTLGSAGWSADTAKLAIDTDNSKLTFSATGTSNDEEIYYDLTSVSDSEWVLRFQINFTSIGTGAMATNQQVQFGIFDTANPSGAWGSGDTLGFLLSSGGTININNSAFAVIGGTATEGRSNGSPFYSGISMSIPYYIEIVRTSTDELVCKVFTGSDYSTGQVTPTLTRSTTSGVNGLRYLMVKLWGESTSTAGAVGSITNLEFYNEITSVSSETPTYETTFASSYPNLPNGATFLTSDTNKLYMWNGTDTWNEVA